MGNYDFEDEMDFNEEDIYEELSEEEFAEDSCYCEQCGSANARMFFDPYSDSASVAHYCELCAPEDFLTV